MDLRWFVVVNPNKLLNKISKCRWFETPWRSCDVNVVTRWWNPNGPLSSLLSQCAAKTGFGARTDNINAKHWWIVYCTSEYSVDQIKDGWVTENLRVAIMPALSSMMVPGVVVMITFILSATTKIDIMITLRFHWWNLINSFYMSVHSGTMPSSYHVRSYPGSKCPQGTINNDIDVLWHANSCFAFMVIFKHPRKFCIEG